VTKMPMDTCIRTRKIIKCFILIDSYLHHVYVHAKITLLKGSPLYNHSAYTVQLDINYNNTKPYPALSLHNTKSTLVYKLASDHIDLQLYFF
jgi:hypothetical protein